SAFQADLRKLPAPAPQGPRQCLGMGIPTPRHTILPASSTHTAVRLKPTSSPANILIAALLPSLEESPAERVAFPPESSNLMYGMYYRLTAARHIAHLRARPDSPLVSPSPRL